MLTINDLNHVWEYLYYNRCRESVLEICIEAEKEFKGHDLNLKYTTDPETGDPNLTLEVCMAPMDSEDQEEAFARYKELDIRVDKFWTKFDPMSRPPIDIMVGW